MSKAGDSIRKGLEQSVAYAKGRASKKGYSAPSSQTSTGTLSGGIEKRSRIPGPHGFGLLLLGRVGDLIQATRLWSLHVVLRPLMPIASDCRQPQLSGSTW